ncbi:MAG: pitrilysin family protein [Paracoccaceae bacterium]|nr:pitrilysin family protein [Paracoccaceae bacterium]
MKHIFAALILSVIAAPLSAQDNVKSFTLANGMEGVVIEDHRSPVVVNMVWYRAGAADEPRGKSGIAHMLEHLLFKGTENLAPGEFSKTVAANGGSDNAFTAKDYTAYFQRVAADRLELMMKMEADRMRNLRISEEDVLTERDVVLEERNQRTDSDPSALFGEQRTAAQYLNHPYGIPIIGWRHEAEKLSRADALAFYETYYSPNNAILVVAGDVTTADVQALAEKHFGPLEPSLDLPVRARVLEPPHLAERRLKFSDERVAQPYIIRSYLAPERNAGEQSEAAALTILAELLGGSSQTSFLGKRLQFDEQIAVYSSAFYSGQSLDATTFGLVVVPAANVSLQDTEDALDRVVAEFLEQPINQEQMGRIKQQIKASEIYGRDSLRGLANSYGSALTQGLTLNDVAAWPEVLAAVTEEDIKAVAVKVFDRRQAVTGWLMRKGEEQ